METNDADDTMKIGSLYDFDLYIRRQKEAFVDNGMFEYRYQNVFYAESKDRYKIFLERWLHQY